MGKSLRAGWVLALAALAVGVGLSVAVWAPYHQPPPPPPEQEPEAQVVTIKLGNFYFEGPVGRSDSADEPKVVVRLKNGQRYKLVFENTTGTLHQVISPLFAAPQAGDARADRGRALSQCLRARAPDGSLVHVRERPPEGLSRLGAAVEGAGLSLGREGFESPGQRLGLLLVVAVGPEVLIGVLGQIIKTPKALELGAAGGGLLRLKGV